MAYFDQNQDLWVEVDASTNLPESIQTIGHVYAQQDPTYRQTSLKAVTMMNLTKYIHDQTLIKIMNRLDKENSK